MPHKRHARAQNTVNVNHSARDESTTGKLTFVEFQSRDRPDNRLEERDSTLKPSHDVPASNAC
ncbi:hypothetical protein X801_07279, partial [Opisthorchis viverrini]